MPIHLPTPRSHSETSTSVCLKVSCGSSSQNAHHTWRHLGSCHKEYENLILSELLPTSNSLMRNVLQYYASIRNLLYAYLMTTHSIEILTPGHFTIGRPVEAIPDSQSSFRSMSLLHRLQLCQALIRHFWQRWYSDYITTLRPFVKWHTDQQGTLRLETLLWFVTKVLRQECGHWLASYKFTRALPSEN